MFESLKEWTKIRACKAWLDRYERFLIPFALIVGVVIDFVTFRTLQISWSFLILALYLVLASLSIILLNASSLKHRVLLWMQAFAPLVLQFVFGALLSASLVFYWFSGALSVSWPILILLAILMTSNEVLRHYYLRPLVQMSVLFFVLFSVSTSFFPYLFHTIDAWVFLLSGLLSFVVMLVFTILLSQRSSAVQQDQSRITIAIFLIALFMNGLYVLNVIPPIPLSLREAQVVHRVERAGDQYRVFEEQKTWMESLFPVQTIHLTSGERAFVYTAIFAPTKLSTSIEHHWSFYDESTRTWVDRGQFSFPLFGGRDEGYRGYSYKSALQTGKWRVRVTTPQGQVLASIRFNLVTVETPVSLIQTFR